jgi:TP901 family phage tail tape measure protein
MAKPTIAELQVRIDLQGMGKLAQLTQALNRVGGAAIRRQLDAQAKALLGIDDAAKKAGKSTSAFGNFLKMASRGTIVAQGLYRGFKMVGGAIASSLKPLMDFEHNMMRVRAKGQMTAAEAKAASDVVKSLTGQTQYGPVAASEAAVGLAAAGKGKELGTALPTVLKFAQANDIQPEKSTEILLGVAGQFGRLDEPGALKDIGNMITKADQMSVLTVSQIYDTLKYVGPLAKDAKMPLQEVLSLIVSLGDAGIVGSKGGTGTRNLLTAIAAPPRRAKQSQKQLDKIRLTQADLQAGFEDIPKFLKGLKARFKQFHITPVEQMAINKTLFGQYGMTASSALMNDSLAGEYGISKIEKARNELEKVGDVIAEQANLMGGTLKNRLEQVNSEWELMQVNMGQLNLPKLNEAVDKLLAFMRGGGGQAASTAMGELTTALTEGLPAAMTIATAAIMTTVDAMRAIDKMLGTKLFSPPTFENMTDQEQDEFVREAAEKAQNAKIKDRTNNGVAWLVDETYISAEEAGEDAVKNLQAQRAAQRLQAKKARMAKARYDKMTPEEKAAFDAAEKRAEQGRRYAATGEFDATTPPAPAAPGGPHVPGQLFVMVELGDGLKGKIASVTNGSGPALSAGVTSQ